MIRHSAALIASALLALSATSSLADNKAGAAAQMQHFKIKFVEPKQPSGSFGAQPKEYWRVSTKLGRVLEAEDAEHHMHQLLIVSPPDIWAIELDSKQAKHIKISAKEVVHFPIFPGHGPLAQKIMNLEYGMEQEWFKSHSAKKISGEKYNGRPADKYEAKIDTITVMMLADPKTNQPLYIGLSTSKGKQLGLEYVAYDAGPVDGALFKPPQGLKIVDVKAAAAPGKGAAPTPGKPTGTMK